MHRSLLAASVVLAWAGVLHAQTVLQSWPFAARLVGDVDGDGTLDLVSTSGTQISLHSSVTGALLAQFPVAWPNSYIYPSDAGDVNGDGRDDLLVGLVMGNNPPAEIRVVSGTNGAVLHSVPLSSSGYVYSARLDDITGDGKAEFMIGIQTATVAGIPLAGRLDVYNGATGAIVRSELGTTANQGLGRVVTVGDLDGDGKRDYLRDGFSMPASAMSGRTGQPLFALPSWYDALNVIDLGDVDGDGHDDFTHDIPGSGQGPSTQGFQVVSGRTGAMIWTHNATRAVMGSAGDLDGDGFGDIVLAGGLSIPGFIGMVVSGRDFSVVFETGPAQGWFTGSPGDTNSDGVPDLVYILGFPVTHTTRVVSGLAPGVAPFGTACPDSLGVSPVLGVGAGARLGANMTVNLSRAHPNAQLAVLGMGFDNVAWNGVPLPIGLGTIGWNACSWFVAGDVLLPVAMTGAAGQRRRATHQVQVPWWAPIGVDVFSQWAILEPGSVGLNGCVTRAVRTRIVP